MRFASATAARARAVRSAKPPAGGARRRVPPISSNHATLGALMLQRQPAGDEAREHLLQGYQQQEQETLQRQPAGGAAPAEPQPAAAGEQDEGERILMQSKPAGPGAAPAGAGLESGVRALGGGGEPLAPAVRGSMETRFGRDFGDVRIHADDGAGELARRANARAFTVGSDVVFAPGEYAPERSHEGRRLLAHELAHVVQQGRSAPALRRKIVVGGKPYTPSAAYSTYLTTNFGPAMREFVERMHNNGNPPDYAFTSYEQMGNEVRVRANAIKGIEEVHKGCCDYFDTAHPAHLDPTFWDKIPGGAPWDFQLKSPLPAGKKPSDAIASIFAPGAGTRLECYSMTVAIEYYSMLKGLGAAAFDARFASGIHIGSPSAADPASGAGAKFQWIYTVASKTDILPGDWVYFKNFADYTTVVPGGYWQGENAIYLGGGKYRGFGVGELAEDDMNKELVKQYNDGGHVVPPKTVADLLANGGGLWLKPILRPISAKLPPP